MDANRIQSTPIIKKETKNKIRVEFEGRTSAWERFKLKVFSVSFLKDVVWYIFRLILLIGISYVIIYPFISKAASSFMSREDFVDATVLLIAKHPTLETYKAVIVDNEYFRAMLNTFVLSASTAIIQTFITCLIGYGFAKFKFKGRKLLFMFVVLTMIVPHSTVRLSMFMKFRYFDILGIFNFLGGGVFESIDILKFTDISLINSFMPFYILSATGLAFKNGLYIFMLRQFFRGVPDELEESAYIDGSGPFRTFVQIILPLSVPMLITVFMFAFSWQWTDNYYTRVFFTHQGPYTLRAFIKIPRSLDTEYPGQNMYVAAIRNTCGILIMLPLILIYAFLQRYLVQGIERSGIIG